MHDQRFDWGDVIRRLIVCLWFAVAPVGVASAQYAEEEPADPRGDVFVTALGGLGGVAIGGGIALATLAWANDCGDGADQCGDVRLLAGLSAAVLLSPLLISAGTTLAGGATGGTGRFFATFLGFVGALPGIAMFAGSIGSPGPLAASVVVMELGYLAGAIIGYRWSADDPSPSPMASVALLPVPNGAILSLGGGF